MIAYGAARYALTSGDKKQATELWPLIEWCLTKICKRKLNSGGVVDSDTVDSRAVFRQEPPISVPPLYIMMH